MRREALSGPPLGPGFTEEEVARADRLEIWCTSFGDSGGDYTEFRLIGAADEVVATRRVGGY